ncbi:MAG: hypothetical protein IKL89_01350 [Clostridia bacterium]|nr:hypothetical protein [Clostridia bacterium]
MKQNKTTGVNPSPVKEARKSGMRRIGIPLLVFVLVLVVVAAAFGLIRLFSGEEVPPESSVSDPMESQEPQGMSNKTFLDTIQGYWAYADTDTSCSTLRFENRQLSFGAYPGDWIASGNVEKIVKKDDFTFEVTVTISQTETDESASSEETKTFLFASEDRFENSLTMTKPDGAVCNYLFVGDSQDQMEEKCPELIFENRDSYYYLGKSVRDVQEAFGEDYFINRHMYGKGMGITYADCAVWFKYMEFYNTNWDEKPRMSAKISRIIVEEPELKVYKDIRIGDSMEDVAARIEIKTLSDGYTRKSYLDDAVIEWIFNGDVLETAIIEQRN